MRSHPTGSTSRVLATAIGGDGQVALGDGLATIGCGLDVLDLEFAIDVAAHCALLAHRRLAVLRHLGCGEVTVPIVDNGTRSQCSCGRGWDQIYKQRDEIKANARDRCTA